MKGSRTDDITRSAMLAAHVVLIPAQPTGLSGSRQYVAPVTGYGALQTRFENLDLGKPTLVG
jgi:cellulose biosynthesis protein BcsQ